jgi:hypothetical protein
MDKDEIWDVVILIGSLLMAFLIAMYVAPTI